jgi:hypothetical protein
LALTDPPYTEAKEPAAKVLAAVFGGGSEKIADGQREERGVTSPVSEN